MENAKEVPLYHFVKGQLPIIKNNTKDDNLCRKTE